MDLEERRAQTTVKHEILNAYMRKWGPIITNGLNAGYLRNPNQPREKVRFMYIDYSSFMGAYQQQGQIVDGSPLIGVKALDDIGKDFLSTTGSPALTTALLFEKNPKTFKRLLQVLDGAGFGHRIKHIDKQEIPGDGDIGVICGDSSEYVPRILGFIDRGPKTFSLHFIDPFGIKSLKRKNLEVISSKSGVDCIINLMVNTASRFMGIGLKEDLNQGEVAHAEHFDQLYGSDAWRQIAAAKGEEKITRREAETQLAQLFYSILKANDSKLRVKQIPLKFEDRNQLLYQLFLTTHNAYGSLAMNEILAGALVRAHDYRRNKRELKAGQQSLFGHGLSDPASPTEPDANLDFLAEEMYAACRGKQKTYGEVLDALADTTAYFEKDMRGALTILKKVGRASFESGASALTNRSKIVFQ